MKIKDNLRKLLADSHTEKVIKQLNDLTKKDNELHSQAIALSARYQKYLLEKHGYTGDISHLDIEMNRINAAALDLIDRLPEDILLFVKKWSWQKIIFWLGVFAAIATITGYTMKDFFQQDKPLTDPLKHESKLDTSATLTPPAVIEKVAPTTGKAKNNVSIEVKDNAKVGNIITGDSNKIDIKQDF